VVMNRRTLLKSFCAGGSLALAEPGFWLSRASESGGRPRIWDVHSHLHSVPGATPEERMAALIQFADRLGIERLLLSQGYPSHGSIPPTVASLRDSLPSALATYQFMGFASGHGL
jgi:hypothetical protein